MSPESNMPGLLFTTGSNVVPGALSDGSGCRLSQTFSGLLFTTSFNVMPGVLSDRSGCRLSQNFPVCYSLPVLM